MQNVYFDLTEAFNADGPVVALASGQAVVYYRVTMMSKDGDWIVRETPAACSRVLSILESRGARYRPSAPLDVRWLAGGWSSHFELFDAQRRRIRCDFFSRPPRVRPDEIAALFAAPSPSPLLVVGLEPLIRMKQTQRAKDYPVIAELARRLPPEKEIELTTDPDRILALAKVAGLRSVRPGAQASRTGQGRAAVVAGVALEIDQMRQVDQRRMAAYQQAASPYVEEFRKLNLGDRPLSEAHRMACELAQRLLPVHPESPEEPWTT